MLDAASVVFRERGYAGAGVDAVARAAGVTSGAFYSHFASKEECLAAVVEQAITANESNRERGLESAAGTAWLEGMLRRYLSPAHWRAIGEGCPIPTLVSELPRCGTEPRRAFTAALESLLERMRSKVGTDADDMDLLMAALSMAVGAMALARAVADEDMSQRLLHAAADRGIAAMTRSLSTEGDDGP